MVAVLASVLVLVAAAAGLAVVRPGPVAGWLGGADGGTPTADPPDPMPSPVLDGVTANAPMPTRAGVQAAVDPLVDPQRLGGRVNISVLDIATGEVLYERGPDALTVPASTTKLVTGLTVLAARGPGYRIPTRAVAGAQPGEVVLIGGGDPTLAMNATGSYPGAARLDQLAEQVKAALGGAVPTRVTVDSSLYSGPIYEPGWDSDIPTGGCGGPVMALMTDAARANPKNATGCTRRLNNPDIAAGQAFAKALGMPAAAVQGVARGTAPTGPGTPSADASGGSVVSTAPTATAAGPGPEGAMIAPGTELGQVQSPPMYRLVEFMLSDSENLIAEALARQVALARQQPASFAGGAAAVDAVLVELGLPEAESGLADGSGLSRTNRLTPSLLTDLIMLAAGGTRPELVGIFGGLPVAGWSGTLSHRFRSPAAGSAAGAGVVRAKTGTLSGVNAISGVVTTAEGRLLAFAILADQVPTDSSVAQPALDRIAGALASCGCR
ncbi:D-alanyl-D-alanine carboxypeptidase/D-alanyl-D-alanine-endopeptidase [Polymorphospora lycopeni]|uniref:D-alanyl-D-alanine carboxypeptidase/D-alanyl-D-alanine-endopeptidase n=1 Tax=Polymorphospora lycopeni TaxID=3140240 RepID=A0ABV5D2S2_9ACTN